MDELDDAEHWGNPESASDLSMAIVRLLAKRPVGEKVAALCFNLAWIIDHAPPGKRASAFAATTDLLTRMLRQMRQEAPTSPPRSASAPSASALAPRCG